MPVDHDFELGAPGMRELRNKAICVAQFRNPGLSHQINGGAFAEQSRLLQVQSRTDIDQHEVELLAGGCQQPVDSVI